MPISQETELSALGLSKLARRNLVVAGFLVCLLAIAYLAKVIERKEDIIASKDVQIVKCKDDLAAKIEHLMTQAQLNAQAGNNILGRQSIIIDRINKIDAATERIERKKK